MKATAKTIVIAKLVFRATTTVAASVTSVTMFVVIKAGAAMEIITQQGAAGIQNALHARRHGMTAKHQPADQACGVGGKQHAADNDEFLKRGQGENSA